MKKELLEKIKRVGEIVAEKYFAEFSYNYTSDEDSIEMVFYDGAFVNTVTIKTKVFEENTIAYCVAKM